TRSVPRWPLSRRDDPGLGGRPQRKGRFLAARAAADRTRGAGAAAPRRRFTAASNHDQYSRTAGPGGVGATLSRLPQIPDRSTDMNWNLARGLVYLACLAASGLAMAGLADFDLATGTLDIRPFNLYALTGAGGGLVSSLLASVALLRGWGRK